MEDFYLDASDLVVGRFCTVVAKKALLGSTIKIFNCEKAIITGNKADVFTKFKQRRDRGTPHKGPFYPRMPDRFVRRSIRGMLPYKQLKGSEAYKKVLCYIGIPHEFKEKKLETLPQAKCSSIRYVSVEDVCKFLGANW